MLSGSGIQTMNNQSNSQISNNLRAKWARGTATEANSKNSSPSGSFRTNKNVSY